MTHQDLIAIQIELELHALAACGTLAELLQRERATVSFLEGILPGGIETYRYLKVLLKSHIRFMEETQDLDVAAEILLVTRIAARIVRDEISPGLGVLQILEERGVPRGPAWIAFRKPTYAGPWELEDEED